MTEKEQEEQRRAREADLADIAANRQVSELLALPAFAEILRGMEKQYFDEFRAADTEPKRQNAWAKSAVMQDFLGALKGVKNRAVVAQAREENRVAAEAARSRTSRR